LLRLKQHRHSPIISFDSKEAVPTVPRTQGRAFWGNARGLAEKKGRDCSPKLNCIQWSRKVERRYDVSINPRSTRYGAYSFDLAPSVKRTVILLKNTYANKAELCSALDRLGIADEEKISILYHLDRGDIYRILSFPVPDEVAITFGWVFDHEQAINQSSRVASAEL
jgi:hypothetical protein